ncbi:DNA circularization N-terminal domain-containing protein [Methylomonas sp. BW4-1]|uniref:DNA circularization N-terminal domain-containing protein n=1 Tax=unclassified Methylomonas TaxID=2608980 RepID=UPI001967DF68|nr:DNA circularization N-terminal domain-containing protein [Methylomonas sp. EFPC1]QSB03461.1 DNA circularization N-terminal domain-containing protein [Methylomonas sp. EFPC1]
MAESYRDRWSNARWRDIEFLTDSHEAKGGRRKAVHEFPGAEEPVVEDMGGKAGDFQLNAYFIGNDYDREAVELIKALNQPGADWLLHPWLGRIWVVPVSWSRRDSNDANGFCTVSISWVVGGEQPQEATPDQVDIAVSSIDGFADAAVGDFDLSAMSAGGLSAFVAQVQGKLEFVRQAISFATLPLTWSSQLLGLVSGIKGDLGTLAAIPGNYANALRSLTNAIGVGADDAGLADTDRPRLVARLVSLSANTAYNNVSGVAATDSAVRGNLARDAALQSRLFLAAAMRVALVDYRAEADRTAALTAIDTAYDTLLPTLPDAVFQAAVTARTALVEAVMAQDLRPQQVRDLVGYLPSTVLAHRLQIDEDVFLARNGVRHPLFVRGRVYG